MSTELSGWQGYFSTPAKANAAHGRAVERWWIDGCTQLILRAVRGQNLFTHSRLPDAGFANTAAGAVLKKALDNERAFGQKLEAWLARQQKD